MPDTNPRQAGKKGLLPQREGNARYAIRYADEYFGALPDPAYPLDVSGGITEWGMLGNDTYGDCGPCAVAHERMLARGVPTAEEVETLYFAFGKSQGEQGDQPDEGVVLADFLLWLYENGWVDGFAPVRPGTEDQVMAATGRGIMLGVNLCDGDMDAFNESRPWTLADGRPDPNEGHAVLLVKSAAKHGDGTLVTWGADQVVGADWRGACVVEAWTFITKDDRGMPDYEKLRADLSALPRVTIGEDPAPAPVPAPTPPAPEPVPDPTPTPDPVDPPAPVPVPPVPPDLPGFIRQIQAIVAEAIRELQAAEEDLEHGSHGILAKAEHLIEAAAEAFLRALGFPQS